MKMYLVLDKVLRTKENRLIEWVVEEAMQMKLMTWRNL